MNPLKSNEPPAWESIKLGQFQRLIQLGEYGKLKGSENVFFIDPSTFSREISLLEAQLGIGDLTEIVHHQLRLSEKGQWVVELFQPWIKLCERVTNQEMSITHPKCLRIGAGGSLVSWLIGSRLNEIKDGINAHAVAKDGSAPKFSVEILPHRNRDIVLQVASGALDFGLVRQGVLGDKRLPVYWEKLGIVTYYIYVPDKWVPIEYRGYDGKQALPFELESTLLNEKPIATVGPEGEFRRNLDAAAEDAGIYPNIEFSYRAFPMLIPHMLLGNHITLMPDIQVLDGQEVKGYLKFPLGLLSNYHRHICLVYHQRHKKLASWLKVEDLVNALTFPRPGSER
jgi:DNA-binding transcriptional LysR family regulator